MPEECLKKLRDFFLKQGIEPRAIQLDEKIDQDVSFVATLRPSLEKIIIK